MLRPCARKGYKSKGRVAEASLVESNDLGSPLKRTDEARVNVAGSSAPKCINIRTMSAGEHSMRNPLRLARAILAQEGRTIRQSKHD
jgi:hypothetical protein